MPTTPEFKRGVASSLQNLPVYTRLSDKPLPDSIARLFWNFTDQIKWGISAQPKVAYDQRTSDRIPSEIA